MKRRLPTFVASTILIIGVMLLPLTSYSQQPGSGYALNFNGAGDYCSANSADLATYTDNFTMEFWVRSTVTRTTKTESTSGITGTAPHGQHYAVYPSHGGAANAGAGVSVGTNGVSVYEHGAGYLPALLVYDTPLTGWNHIAVVYTAKQPSLYINGILVKTGLTSARTAVFPSARLGGHPYGWHTGDIDEYRVWSTSRTQTEIRDNMCQKLTGVEAGLVRYLRLDDGAGTSATDVMGVQNGVMVGVPAWVTSGASIGNTSTHQYASAWGGSALDFDGSNDFVNGFAADLAAITDNFTMEMWVNPTGTITIHGETNCASCISGTGTPNQRYAMYPEHGGATPGVAGAGISVGTNGIQIVEHAAGYMPVLASYSGTISGWNHVAVVYTGKQPTIYLNGVAVRTGLTSLRTSVYPSCHVGGIVYGHFLGQIDDVRIWNSSRSVSQIAGNMCGELTGAEAGLVRYYKFDDGAGTTATDATGTNNGTLVNMVPASDWVATGAGTCLSGTITHSSPELDQIEISGITGYTQGMHVYHVDAVPSSVTGISGLGGNDHYYGAFKSGEVNPTTYTATYTYTENDAFQNSEPTLDETNMILYTRSDNSITSWSNSGAAVNAGANTLTATAMSTEFILGLSIGALPIELLSFEGHLNNGHVDLTWVTATETNNDYFIVERSKDGNVWEEVLEVDGAGNSSSVINYFDKDYDPYPGISYYRLRQVDFDGTRSYSDIVPVELLANGETGIVVYPNPTNGNQSFNIGMKGFNGSEVVVVVRDITGKEFFSKVIVAEEDDGYTAIDPKGIIPAGVYLVTATSNNKIYSQRLIIK
jgi:hypothetical protein